MMYVRGLFSAPTDRRQTALSITLARDLQCFRSDRFGTGHRLGIQNLVPAHEKIPEGRQSSNPMLRMYVVHLAAPLLLSLPPPTFIARRSVFLGGAAAAAASSRPTRAIGYDSIPSAASSAAFNPDQLVQARKAREAKAAKQNKAVAPLVARVRASTTPGDFDAAMTDLTLWIIGTGDPIPPPSVLGATTYDGPLPDGFQTRELVSACRTALDALPRYTLRAGTMVQGLPECVETRTNGGVCTSAGPLAESAYKAMLRELKARAPRQYDTPYGPVAF